MPPFELRKQDLMHPPHSLLRCQPSCFVRMFGGSATASKEPNFQDTMSHCLCQDSVLFAGCLLLTTTCEQHRATASVRPLSWACEQQCGMRADCLGQEPAYCSASPACSKTCSKWTSSWLHCLISFLVRRACICSQPIEKNGQSSPIPYGDSS